MKREDQNCKNETDIKVKFRKKRIPKTQTAAM